LKEGRNYGVTAAGGLIKLESDDVTRWEKLGVLALMPETPEVQSSAANRKHFYLFGPMVADSPLWDPATGEDIGHIRGTGEEGGRGGMVVGPGSKHPSGTTYTVIRDGPIATIDQSALDKIKAILSKPEEPKGFQAKANDLEKKLKQIRQTKAKSMASDLKDPFENVYISEILGSDYNAFHQEGLQMAGPNPYGNHSNSTGHNMVIDPDDKSYYCFACQQGGGPSRLLAIKHNLMRCNNRDSPKGEDWWNTIRFAVGDGLITKEQAFAAGLPFPKTTKQEVITQTLPSPINLEESVCVADIEDDGKKKESISTQLVRLAKSNCVELWHTPTGKAYITLYLNGHKEYKIIDSKPVKTWLSRLASDFLLETVSSNILKSSVMLLEGNALYDGKEYELHVRKAEIDGKIYVDIGDSAWRVIEISKEGWKITDDCPIRFYRPKSLLALPEPMPGGDIEEIKKLVNISKEEAWIKYTAWLSQAFWCQGPFVHLFVRGPQGSAKSALAETSKDLIDPSRAPRRHLPQSPRELMMACQNEASPSFDNVSEFSDLIADTLCTVSTGGSSAARELYTDSDESLIYAKNPIIMNGIADPSQRGDLLDRLMILDLEEIEEKDRISEKEMNKRKVLLYPKLLGCILDATVTGLQNEDIVKLTGSPRMADFTEWAVACSRLFAWDPEKFLTIYQSARAEAQNEMASANRVLRSIRLFLAVDRAELEKTWEGQASELLDILNHRESIMEGREPEGWPRSPKTMSDETRRLEVSAKGVGIVISRRRSNGKNLIKLAFGSVPSVQEQLAEVSKDELNINNKGSNSVSSVYSVSSFKERLIVYRSKTPEAEE
jgi:hypothetical protein